MDRQRIEAAIRDIATSPKNVHFDDLVNLLDNHIKHLFPGYNHHGNPHHAFTVAGQTFNIAKPHGQGKVKSVYVRNFLAAMEAAGLYSPEEKK